VHVVTVPLSLRFLHGQVRFMADHGFLVSCVSAPGPEQAEFLARESVPVYTVPMTRVISPFRDLRSLWQLARLLRRLRPTIVHAHTPKGGLLGMLAAGFARTPVRVYHMRGLPIMSARGARRALLSLAERLSCRLADRVICVSHGLRRLAIAEGLCPEEKIVTLLGGSGNGVDSAGEFNPAGAAEQEGTELRRSLGIAPRDQVIGFIGRLVRDKGIIELAEAWSALRDRFSEAHLLLAGPEENRDAVPPRTIASLRQDPRVHLLGRISSPRRVYAASDLIVLPSHREGFPNVALEAAAMRRAVVATRIEGCDEAVVDGLTGALVPVGDARALAAAMETYLRDRGLRDRHGSAGQERVRQEFRREAIWEALLGEYWALLRSRGVAPAGE
jgi:glycosyltransferase involved in cell wall biosynthesis